MLKSSKLLNIFFFEFLGKPLEGMDGQPQPQGFIDCFFQEIIEWHSEEIDNDESHNNKKYCAD
jgi:hypothetical protein